MVRVFCLPVLAAIVLGGCGSGAVASDSDADGLFSTCPTESRAMPYVPGMQVTSTSGALTIKLLRSVPGPPVKGRNTWTMEVDQPDAGTTLDGLNIGVVPYMPDHRHGATAPVVVTAAGPGMYTFEPVHFFMSGYWEIRMTLAGVAESAGIDDAMLPICIP